MFRRIFLGKSFNSTSRKAENEKRRREAEALQARMEREKQELRAYIEKDNTGLVPFLKFQLICGEICGKPCVSAMKSKMTEEEEARKRKEEEMKKKLAEQVRRTSKSNFLQV